MLFWMLCKLSLLLSGFVVPIGAFSTHVVSNLGQPETIYLVY